MNLTRKTLSVLAGVIALSIALNYAVLQRVVFPTFVELEQAEAERNVGRSLDAIQNELGHLSRFVWDWSEWDDSYEFVQNPSDDYVESNLVESAFAGNEINLILFYDAAGKRVWGQAYDLENEERIEFDQLPSIDFSPTHSLLNHPATDSVLQGVILTARGAMLIASRPVLTSEGEGPAKGTLLMGRFLNEPVIERLRQQTQVNFQIWPLDEKPGSPDEQQALAQLGANQKVVLRETGNDVLAGYSLMPDHAGKPAILLRANTPKSITAAGLGTVKVAVMGLVAAGLISLLVMAFSLQRVVVGPLLGLTQHILEIGRSNDLSRRTSIMRRDEIGLLGQEFDRMLGQLQEAQRRLAEQSFQSGLAEMAAGVLHNVRNQLSPLALRIGRLKQACAGPPDDKLKKALGELADGSTPADRSAKLVQYVTLSTENLRAAQSEVRDQLDAMSQQITKLDAVLSEQDRISRAELVIRPAALFNVLGEALDFIPDNPQQEIDVTIDPDVEQLRPVLVQEFMLKQVFVNLLVNAAEAINASDLDVGRIEVSALVERLEEGETVHLQVRDNGQGIEPDNLGQVFERGFTTKGDQKRGLGLHWCANSLASMGGRIWAESEGPGRGAILHVLLPAGEAMSEAA